MIQATRNIPIQRDTQRLYFLTEEEVSQGYAICNPLRANAEDVENHEWDVVEKSEVALAQGIKPVTDVLDRFAGVVTESRSGTEGKWIIKVAYQGYAYVNAADGTTEGDYLKASNDSYEMVEADTDKDLAWAIAVEDKNDTKTGLTLCRILRDPLMISA